ncbi:MAG: hypothetical protein ABIE23_01255 [archaeon]
MGKKIRVAVAGVGNCASSLIQGVHYYSGIISNDSPVPGLMHNVFGEYKIKDIEFVAAFDIDERKVGKDLSQAIFAKPNCTAVFQKDIPELGVEVLKGPVLDGVAKHMADYPLDRRFSLSKEPPVDVAAELKKAEADVLINYMPVGSEEAAKYYANAALDAGCGFINCMPVFIASNKELAKKFEEKKLPIIGDDIKSQLGATIVHRTLARLFAERGLQINNSYQINVGGNSVTADQEIILLVNNRLRRMRIGDFIDSFINIYGKKKMGRKGDCGYKRNQSKRQMFYCK